MRGGTKQKLTFSAFKSDRNLRQEACHGPRNNGHRRSLHLELFEVPYKELPMNFLLGFMGELETPYNPVTSSKTLPPTSLLFLCLSFHQSIHQTPNHSCLETTLLRGESGIMYFIGKIGCIGEKTRNML